ncbi:hypothetical protein [Streptomyces sp. AC555_RSS877]|uniref:hypothetical protein n=1 Tax=Streptomyces sp. AC555_RSS877 TaxID=2823688 RepID=UPI001C257E9D|nr:hypothetical protein [Streptomyces sp. AC555_RSS877]
MNPDKITAQSQKVSVRVALPVLDHERSHRQRQRQEVVCGAGTRTGGRLPLDG